MVEHLRDRLRRSGFETHVVIPAGHGPTGRAWSRPARRRARDPPSCSPATSTPWGSRAWTEPFAATVDGDRLSGRGSSDMKGGVAAMVVAAEELVRRRLRGRVVLALVADEEDASLGAEAVLAALPGLGIQPDVAVVGEPTWLAVAASLRGYALVEVTFAGRAAHSSQPDEGVNAVAHLGRLLGAVEARDAEIAGHGASLMVTVASGGDSPFVLARSARALVERRTVPGRGLRRRARRGRGAARHPAGRRPDGRRARPGSSSPGRRGASTPTGRPRPSPTRSRPPWPAPTPTALCRNGSTRPTGWRRRSGRRPASPPWCAGRRAAGCTRPTSGSTWPGAAVRRRPHRGGRAVGRRGGGRACPLTRGGCAATRRCSTRGCASRRTRRRRSPSPATSSATTSSATSWPVTCRSTPGSTR